MSEGVLRGGPQWGVDGGWSFQRLVKAALDRFHGIETEDNSSGVRNQVFPAIPVLGPQQGKALSARWVLGLLLKWL